jgi:transcriptional regulator with GAF, ATPase, and Fis domain
MATMNSIPQEECGRLDQVVFGASSMLLQLDGSALPPTIERVLQRVTAEVGADRGTLIESGRPDTVEAAYGWARQPVDTRVERDAPRLQNLLERFSRDGGVVMSDDLDGDVRTELFPAVQSAIAIPVAVGSRHFGLMLEVLRAPRLWPPMVVDRLRLLCQLLAAAMHRSRHEVPPRSTTAEAERFASRLRAPTAAPPMLPACTFDEIVGDSVALRTALDRVRRVAAPDSTVLLLGETGTGKELFARAIHENSSRRRHRLVTLNCAALPATLIETELFGHQRGAFTGAVSDRVGRFELAHRGTLFLDEVGDLPAELQAKLLRVLQHKTFERIGSSHTRQVDVRVIAATNRSLEEAVAEGRFRADLYYRLNVFPIRLPPLRERREDIPELVWSVIRKRQHALQRAITHISPAVVRRLQAYRWPGNVRELENVIERALIHSTTGVLTLDDEFSFDAREPALEGTLESVERLHIRQVLQDCHWRINGKGNAAERLGLHPNTLRFRMRKLGIERTDSLQPSSLVGPAEDSADVFDGRCLRAAR